MTPFRSAESLALHRTDERLVLHRTDERLVLHRTDERLALRLRPRSASLSGERPLLELEAFSGFMAPFRWAERFVLHVADDRLAFHGTDARDRLHPRLDLLALP